MSPAIEVPTVRRVYDNGFVAVEVTMPDRTYRLTLDEVDALIDGLDAARSS